MAQNIKQIGDDQSLNKGATTVPSNRAKSGEIKQIGDSQPIGTRPTQAPCQRVKSGHIGSIGDDVTLSHKQSIPWGGQTPLAANPDSLDRSKMSAGKRK